MKGLYIFLALIFLISANLKAQNYTFLYNQYSGMNKAQLNLALEQSQKMKRNGVVWTAVGTGMMVGGGIMTFNGLNKITYEGSSDFSSFSAGLGIMCLGAFPLGYGFVSMITGNEKINMIEIELLASDVGRLDLKPTEYGLGLVLAF